MYLIDSVHGFLLVQEQFMHLALYRDAARSVVENDRFRVLVHSDSIIGCEKPDGTTSPCGHSNRASPPVVETGLMSFEQHPLSAAFPPMSDEIGIFCCSEKRGRTVNNQHKSGQWLPPLDGRAWIGLHVQPLANIILTESYIHPGFYHYEIFRIDTGLHVSSKKPLAVDAPISMWRAVLEDLNPWWEESQALPPDHPGKKVTSNKESRIYVLAAGPFIKVGITRDLERRIHDLQTGCPYPISILTTLPGTHEDEAAIHRRLSSCRSSGEWFWRRGEALTFLLEVL